MTFLEMLLGLAAVSVLLVVVVAASGSLRTHQARKQTQSTLKAVRIALLAYQTHEGHWPLPPTSAALDAMLQVSASAAALAGLAVDKDRRHAPMIRDGYGQPLRYLPPHPSGGGADLVSAGPDGKFGELAPDRSGNDPAALDNLYGAETEALTP